MKDLAGLAKGYVHAQRRIGEKGIIKPKDGAPAEEWDAYWSALGRPTQADAYKLPSDGMPADFKPDPAAVAAFGKEAHRLGLTDQQFAGLVRFQADLVRQQQEAFGQERAASMKAGEAALRAAWGKAYDERLAMVRDMVKDDGGDGVLQLLDDAGLGNDPKLLGFLGKLAVKIGRDEVIGKGGSHKFQQTPEDALGAIDTLKRDKQFMDAFLDEANAGHKAAVKTWTELFTKAHPEATQG